MKLFRGIAVPETKASYVVETIKRRDMRAGDGHWILIAPDLKEEFKNPSLWSRLISKETLTTQETRKRKVETVSACGDVEAHYSTHVSITELRRMILQS